MKYLFLFISLFGSTINYCAANDYSKDRDMRLSKYNYVSKYMQSLSNDEVLKLLKQGKPLHSGYGSTIKLEIEGIPIFVKQVPLNEIEGKPQNIQSTANLFYLPLYYQYGVGSGGFSVWRELSAHAMTTGWVLAKESQNFPLMYHWRILDSFQEKKPFDEDEFNNHVTYWENSLEIGQRVKANQQALSNVVIFIGLCSDIRPVTSQQPLPHHSLNHQTASLSSHGFFSLASQGYIHS